MKKLLALTLSLALGLTLLAGCTPPATGNDPAPGKPSAPGTETSAPVETTPVEDTTPVRRYPDREEIKMWFWGAAAPQQEYLNNVLCGWYNESQDKYELTIEYSNTKDVETPVALAAGQGPDIVFASGPSYVANYAQANLVLDLTPYAEQYGWKDRLLSVAYDVCTLDGKLYSLPGSLLVGGLLYNKDTFAANGWTPPTTMDELVAILDSAKSKGMYPLGAGNKGWKPNNDHYGGMILSSYVSPSVIYDAFTGKTTFDDPRIMDAVQVTADWYQKGYLAGQDYPNMDAGEVMQTLMNGRSAMVAAPSLFFQWLSEDYGDKIGFVPMPNNYTTDDVYNVSIACNFAIGANSKVPDEAAKILDHMMTGDFALQMSKGWPAYWVLPVKELPSMDTTSLSGLGKACLEAVQNAIPSIDAGRFSYHPATFFPPATVTAFEDIDTVWQGVVDVKTFCATVNNELQNDIANKLVPPMAKPSV